MVEINLLPWREFERAKQKKTRRYFGLILFVTLLLVGLAVHFYQLYAEQQTLLKQQVATLHTKNYHQPDRQASPTLAGYLHQDRRTWGIVKLPNGESHDVPNVKITNPDFSDNHLLSLDLQNVALADAIRLIAKFMHFNVMIAANVKGRVSLHLQNVEPANVLDLLITSHGFTKSPIGNIWFVTPREEWLKSKQDEIKLQEAMNDAAPLITRIWQIHYAKADEIAHLLQDNNYSLLTKHGHVRVDSRTNRLFVQDLAKNITLVHTVIQQLDIPVQQIKIEAHLASVDSDYERQLGINFLVQGSPKNETTHAVADSVAPGTQFSLAVAKLADGSLLDVALAAMENDGKGELISSPSLFTANQQTASIESGEEIPYQEVSLSGGTGIAFKKAVLSLKVTPQIMPENRVLLQLQVNQDRPSSRIVLGVPAISTRQMTTSILVKSGQTLVLGGIYELNKEHDEQRIPFLGKIPLVGLLFQQQNAKENKRELLIFVTPKIL